MSNRTLIVLSKVYPFYPEFLQNEVDAIEAHYDRVIILCCSARKQDILNQPIGSKYVVYRRNETQKPKLKYIKYALIGFTMLGRNNAYREEWNSHKGLGKKIAIAYSTGKVESELKYALKAIKDFSLEDDVVTVYSYWFTDTAIVSAMLKKEIKCRGIQALTRAHGVDLYESRNKLNFIPYRNFCMRELDYIFPCSKDGEMYLKSKFPDAKAVIKHSYLGTKESGLNPEEKSPFYRIVSCSNIVKVKRIDLIIKTLQVLESREIYDIEWVCIGGGPLLDTIKAESNTIKKIAIEFMGPTPNNEVRNYYRNNHIDLFINTSSSEGLPVSIMEAQSMGIPVMATDVGGTKEIVLEETGILLSSNPNPMEIADKIQYMMSLSEESINRIRKSARRNYLDKFNSDINYENFHANLAADWQADI